MIREHRKVQVAELAEEFRVSATTIRSDLREMESSLLLLRTHGGAIERPRARMETLMNQRETLQSAEKKAIARIALDEIQDGDTIMIDVGSTTRELARLLSQRERLTVVTNDLVAACTLENFPGIEVFVIGGTLRKGFQCTIGGPWEGCAAGIVVDKGFFGANGFSVDSGASTPDLSQSATKREMMRMARKVYLLCDSEKFGRVSFSRFASLEEIDTLVTDRISIADRRKLEEADIEVLVPGD
jgi:DeoR family fructose operon transcriptional repressor